MMASKKKPPSALERVEQEALIQWAKVMEEKEPRLRLLNASLNGVRLSPHQAVMAKKGGMKKGYPDVFLPVAAMGYHGLFIEMKRRDGRASDVKKEQRAWLRDLEAQGYRALVCFGWEEAAHAIAGYLGMDEATKTPHERGIAPVAAG